MLKVDQMKNKFSKALCDCKRINRGREKYLTEIWEESTLFGNFLNIQAFMCSLPISLLIW